MKNNGIDAESSKKVIGRPFSRGVSGNPGGRPKGIAALVREKTKDGFELIEIMLEIARGKNPKASVADVINAVRWLGDRGWGKAVESVEHGGLAPMTIQVVTGVPHANESPIPRANLR